MILVTNSIFQGNADFGEVHPNIRVWCNAPTKIAHPGEILISVRAPIGAMNIADCECCIGRGLASISVDESICTTKYLWYDLFSKIEELNSKGTGSTFKAINKKTLEETEVQLRDMDEQRKISETLDKITQLVSLRKQQLAKLDELVKARFVEIFGDPVYNEMHWETKRLIDICRTIVDCPHSTPHYTTKDTGYKCIRTSAVKRIKYYGRKSSVFQNRSMKSESKENDPKKGTLFTQEKAQYWELLL